MTRIWADSANYRVGGELEPIDNDLVAAAGGALSNAANRYDVELPETLADPVEVSVGGASVAFALEGAEGTRSADGNEAVYEDAVPGVDARYTVAADSVKEDLLLAGPESPRAFSFAVDPSAGLTPALTKAGEVEFTDGKGSKVMAFAAPVMTDADGETSDDLAYELERNGDGWTLKLDADGDWLASKDRAWPVAVDPTVCFGIDSYLNTTIDAGAPTTIGNQNHLKAGKTPGGSVKRALLKMTLSGIPEYAVINRARLNLHETAGGGSTGSGTPSIEVRGLSNAFTNAATWNTRNGTNAWSTAGGDFTAAVEDAQAVSASCDCWYQWDIGDLVQAQVRGSANQASVGGRDNFGILLKSSAEGTDGAAGFDGVQTGTWAPWMEINWEDPTGVPSYGTFDTVAINDRSELKVNVVTGNLIYHANDVAAAGAGGYGVQIDRWYQARGIWAGQGNGWTMSAGQDVWANGYGAKTVVIRAPGVTLWRFRKQSDGSWKTPPGVNAKLTEDANGRTLTFNKSDEKWYFAGANHGGLTWREDRNGHRITYAYNSTGEYITSATDNTQSRTYTFTRNAQNFTSQISDASYPGGTRTWGYGFSAYDGNPSGWQTSYTDPNGNVTYYEYEPGTTDLKKITDARGNQIRITYNYDSFGYPRVETITRVTNTGTGTGPTTTYSYDPTNRRTTVTDPNGTATTTPTNDGQTVYTYNQLGQVTKAKDALGHDRDTTFTINGDVKTYTQQSQSGATPATITLGYDGDDNQTSSAGAAGETTSATYYTGADKYRIKDSTNEQGSKQYFQYDAAGNTTKIGDAASLPANVANLAYTTTADAPVPKGLLKTATDGKGNVTTYTHDNAGNLTKMSPPLIGVKRPGEMEYTYDSEGRVKTAKDEKGQSVSYAYDKLDRTCLVATGSQTSLACNDTPAGTRFKYVYDANGNLTSRTDTAGNTSTFTYDQLNRRLTETVAGAPTITYTYDANSNLTRIADTWGNTDYTFDAINRVKTINDPGTQPDVTYTYNDTASIRTQLITFPKTSGTGAGVTLTTSTDLSGKAVAIEAKTSTNTALRKLAYDYKKGSTETTLRTKEDVYNAGTLAKTTRYAYGKLDRLCLATTGTITGGADPCAPTISGGTTYKYEFDNAGNRTIKTAGATVTKYGYDAANQLCWSTTGSYTNHNCTPPSGATSYAHDDNGNRTTGNLTYDPFNRLTSINGAAQTHLNPDNTELIADGTTTLVNSIQGINRSTTGGATTNYIRDPHGSLIGERTASGTRYRMPDALDSTRYLFSGDIVNDDYDYDPDGNITANGTGIDSIIKFAAGHSTSGGYYHFGARYYDPVTARWTQRDPIDQAGDLSEANAYLYAAGDAINLADPDGDCAVCRGAWQAIRGTASRAASGAKRAAQFVGRTRFKFGLHNHGGPHNYPHFQLNYWRAGEKGSGWAIRTPNLKPWEK